MNIKKINQLRAAVKRARATGGDRVQFSAKTKALGIELAQSGMRASELTKEVGINYPTAIRWVNQAKRKKSEIQIIRTSTRLDSVVVNLRLPSGILIESVPLKDILRVLDAVS